MFKIRAKFIAALAAASLAFPALAQTPTGQPPGILTPLVTSIGNTDLFQDIVNGNHTAQSFYAPWSLIQQSLYAQPAKVYNSLVAGDAGQNLWQRGTGGTSTTATTVVWDSADHWGQWSVPTLAPGVKIVKDTTAADLPADYQAMYGLTHTNTTAGQICMGQPLETVDSLQFGGTTAELDFHAFTGAGYTGGSTITAYIVTGTGTDDGLSKMAYTVNLAGTSTGWAGGALATSAVVPLSAVSTAGRFGVIANIPAGITEIGVALCYTPGTTDTNDYVAFGGIQLVRSPALSAFVSTTVAYNAASAGAPVLTAFQRIPTAFDQARQYRYYMQWNEYDTAAVAQSGTGYYVDTTHCQISFPLPVPMFKTPTIQNAAITTSTFTVAQSGGTPAAGAALAGTGNSGLILAVGSTPSAPFTQATLSFITGAKTQYAACILLSTASGAGNFGVTAED